MPPKGHGTGYYLALTFGTLLSSQGADAHDTRPIPWPSIAAASLRYAALGGSQVRVSDLEPLLVGRLGAWSGRRAPGLSPLARPVSPGAERKLRAPRGRCQTGER